MVIWIIGLSGAGKTSLAEEIEKRAHGHHGERERHEHARAVHEHHEEGLGDLRREVEELKRAMQDIRKHLERRDR